MKIPPGFICSGCLRLFFFPNEMEAINHANRSIGNFHRMCLCPECQLKFRAMVNSGNAEVFIQILEQYRAYSKQPVADAEYLKEVSQECLEFRQSVLNGDWLLEFRAERGEWAYRHGDEIIDSFEYVRRMYDYQTLDEAIAKVEKDTDKIHGNHKDIYYDKLALYN